MTRRETTILIVLALRASAIPAAGQTSERLRLTVDEAVTRGVAASHRIEEATARVDAASAVTDQRHSGLLPRVSAQAGYTRTNHVVPFGILYPDVPDNYRTRLDAQWPIYTGGRVQALERAAGIDAVATTHDRSATESDVKSDIGRTYWSLAAADESIRVLDQSLVQMDRHLRDARNRFDAGVIPPNEVSSVEAQQARQQMLRIQAQANRDAIEASLARLCGLAPGSQIEPADPIDGALPMTQAFDALMTEARTLRPDRQALGERVAAADQRASAAEAARRPTIGIGGGFDYARPNPRIFPRQNVWKESWDASINVDWPLFDGGRAKSEVAEATAARRAAEARLAEFDSLLAVEIQQRVSEMTSGRAAVTAAEASIRAAVDAHRIVENRFLQGAATSTDVLDAQIALLQAELDRTQAIAAIRVADVGLARAVGRTTP